MRYGIISDIHSNLEALQEVLESLREEGVDEIVCGGDVVGYGADPGECLALVRERATVTVAGNHDYAAVGLTDLEYFNPQAKEAVLWTRERLDDDERAYLANLRLTSENEDFMLVHATPLSPAEWNYVYTTYDARVNLEGVEKPLCLVGHSHTPVNFTVNDGVTYSFQRELPIEPGHKYLVNVGSVGQPRDGDPRAAYAVYDREAGKVEVKRVEYEMEKTQAKIREAGLPEILAARLSNGQ